MSDCVPDEFTWIRKAAAFCIKQYVTLKKTDAVCRRYIKYTSLYFVFIDYIIHSCNIQDYSITIFGGSIVSTKQIRISESTETFNTLSPSTDYHITVIGNKFAGSDVIIDGTTIDCTTKREQCIDNK